MQHEGIAFHFGSMDNLSRYSTQQVLLALKDSDRYAIEIYYLVESRDKIRRDKTEFTTAMCKQLSNMLLAQTLTYKRAM